MKTYKVTFTNGNNENTEIEVTAENQKEAWGKADEIKNKTCKTSRERVMFGLVTAINEK
jgi:hypothetical protein